MRRQPARKVRDAGRSAARADPVAGTAGWSRVASVTAALAIAAVLSAALVDGVHMDRVWVALLAAGVIAVLERHPLSVTAGRSGRLYFDALELGIGLVAASASPAALGLITAAGFIPTLGWGHYSGWKRVFAGGQAVLGAVAVGVVVRAGETEPVGLATAAAAGLAYFVVTTVPLLAMFTALREPGLRHQTLTSAPATLAGSICALSLGLLLGPPLGASTEQRLLALVAIAGVVIAVRASHLAAMRADRMRVLFAAAAGLGRAGAPTDLDRLLADLGPRVVPALPASASSALLRATVLRSRRCARASGWRSTRGPRPTHLGGRISIASSCSPPSSLTSSISRSASPRSRTLPRPTR